MIVGVYSPVLNWCGGAEWVGINIITALKQQGHQIVLLTDRLLDQEKFSLIFDRKVSIDRQIVFPLRFFSSTDVHNVYTNALRSLMMKLKCRVLVDTFSNALLPGVDVSYIHYPLLKTIESNSRNLVYFYPYRAFLNSYRVNNGNKLVLANSKFTAEAIKSETGVVPQVLYPSVPKSILNHKDSDFERERENNVIAIGRISKQKNLQIIPHIAKLTNKEISFTIVGLLDSPTELHYLNRLITELNVSNRVKVLTNVTLVQLKKLLFCSKVYLHTKVNEHFGISIVEGMSSGCIPIVHDSGGPKELVSPNFRFTNITDAAHKVEKAVEYWSPTIARTFSKKAESFSEENFSKKFMDLFDSYFAGY